MCFTDEVSYIEELAVVPVCFTPCMCTAYELQALAEFGGEAITGRSVAVR